MFTEWSREVLLDNWVRDKKGCCDKAGVAVPGGSSRPPSTSPQVPKKQESLDNEPSSSDKSKKKKKLVSDLTCGICAEDTSSSNSSDEMLRVACGHKFCQSCWRTYLTMKIEEGDVHNIFCPAFECMHLVPLVVIEKLVSPQVALRFQQFDLDAFVEGNPTIKWCPGT